jgi:hypothetical protein
MSGKIVYLVCSSIESGVKDAEARGCTRIGRTRFATPLKDDLRVVSRFIEMIPMAGMTTLIKASDFEDMPNSPSELVQERWLENHDAFEQFVADGHGQWVALNGV